MKRKRRLYELATANRHQRRADERESTMHGYPAPDKHASPFRNERTEWIGRMRSWLVAACLALVVGIINPSVASADEAVEEPLLSYQVGEDGTISALIRDGGTYGELSVDQRVGLPLPASLAPVIEEVLNSDDPSDVLDYIVVVKQKGELVFLRRSHCHGGDCHCHPPC